MFMFENHVRIAIQRIGGPTKASNLLGVSNGAIHAWIKARRVPNIDYAKKVSELSRVQVEDLRPVR